MSKIDVTDRAMSGGWTLPDGWTVQADAYPDDTASNPGDEYDCYTARQISAWEHDAWQFVVVCVWVEDAAGREWGRSVLGGVEAGSFVMTDENDNVTGHSFIDPLADSPAEYTPIRDHDMIGEALRDTVVELEKFGTPVITEPTGTNYSGL